MAVCISILDDDLWNSYRGEGLTAVVSCYALFVKMLFTAFNKYLEYLIL